MEIEASKRGPAWLAREADGSGWVVREDRVVIIKRVFKMVISGLGMSAIASRLNREKVEVVAGRAKNWSPSLIRDLLENRALLGEYQPKDGPPIPAVLDAGLFRQAQGAKQGRNNLAKRGGRRGFVNLFQGCYVMPKAAG